MNSVPEIVAAVRRLPDELRTFSIDRRAARLLYGVTDDVLQQLEEHGLPCRSQAEKRLYDPNDLSNVSLYLGLPSVQRQAMQGWLDTLELVGDAAEAPRFVVKYATMAMPGEKGPRHLQVGLPEGQTELIEAEPGAIVKAIEWTPRLKWPDAAPVLREILCDIASMNFFLIPPQLRQDAGFATRTRLLDCGLASRITITRAQEAGLPMRLRYGLLLAKPAATVHAWAECNIEGNWTPFDPLILATLSRHLGLSADVWPPERSPGAMLLPLGDQPFDVVTDGSQAIPVTFIVETAG